ncbi:Uncharacterized protein dnl_30560 [Desulfonema limicola]|uniref:Uncharacterized protein n=1 Tax=Desulfonema limicola TaxID=45656 RepID=A0A975GH02_9BACT|nr:Uncharacterized protein dnl_30560 [Desulfonema limicola]
MITDAAMTPACFNPCFHGSTTVRSITDILADTNELVSILVFMEVQL